MGEFDTGGQRPASELLDTNYELIEELIPGISSDTKSLKRYIHLMRADHPGLAKQAGVWVGMIRELIPKFGLEGALRAEGAFTAGNLMMYELLRRTAQRTGRSIPNPEFKDDNMVDTEVPEERPEWLIDMAIRGLDLSQKHPVFLDAALEMFSRSQGVISKDELKASLFRPHDPTDFQSFDLVYYLAGSAEVILPIERQAQVDSLNSHF